HLEHLPRRRRCWLWDRRGRQRQRVCHRVQYCHLGLAGKSVQRGPGCVCGETEQQRRAHLEHLPRRIGDRFWLRDRRGRQRQRVCHGVQYCHLGLAGKRLQRGPGCVCGATEQRRCAHLEHLPRRVGGRCWLRDRRGRQRQRLCHRG